MADTTNLGITKLTENQDQPHLTVNEALDELDDFVWRAIGGLQIKTANYSVLKTDRTIICKQTAAIDVTLPAVSGAGEPFAGQEFIIRDASAAGASTYNITIKVPSGAKINGTTDGTVTISADATAKRIVYDGTEYWVV